MSLRLKLSLIGLVVLVLPWSAWRFIGTTERLLRQGEERAQVAATGTLARALAADGLLPPAHAADAVYAWPAGDGLWLDGYGDDWRDWGDNARVLEAADDHRPDPLRARLRLAGTRGTYYLLLTVADRRIVYRDAPAPTAAPADRVRLRLAAGDRVRTVVVDTAAPGPVQARPVDGAGPLNAIWGEWQETGRGYSLELRLPRGLARDGVGVSVRDDDGDGGVRQAGTGPDGEPSLLPVVERSGRARARLAALSEPGTRAWVVDAHGRIIARHGDPAGTAGGGVRWLRNLVYRHILASPLEPVAGRDGPRARLGGTEVAAALAGRPAAVWRAASGGGVTVATAHPLTADDGAVRGAVITERAGEGVLLLTDSAMVQVLATVLVAIALALGALTVYAARLSGRIRRLRNAAAGAVDEAGRVDPRLPELTAGDEIGDLARGLGRTLERLREYTRYLRSLTGRLSHELRTPLTVVNSSLENLAQTPLDADARRYAERARDGVARLGAILRAMSEATRVEQTVDGDELEPVELDALLDSMVAAYGDVHPDRAITLAVSPGDYRLPASPERLGQMVDKLVDNAVDFSPRQGWIVVGLERTADGIALSVANEGPLLPAGMQSHLFDSLVSVRDKGGDADGGPHLGLGLYIVRLIAERHGGWVKAANRGGGDGVVVTVHLPSPA